MKCSNPRELLTAIRATGQASEHGMWVAVVENESRDLQEIRLCDTPDSLEEMAQGWPELYDTSTHHLAFAHPHPSGKCFPGEHDLEMTKSLFGLAASMGYGMADHIIFTDDSTDSEGNGSEECFSFVGSGLLPLLTLAAMSDLMGMLDGIVEKKMLPKRKAGKPLPPAMQKAVDAARKRMEQGGEMSEGSN